MVKPAGHLLEQDFVDLLIIIGSLGKSMEEVVGLLGYVYRTTITQTFVVTVEQFDRAAFAAALALAVGLPDASHVSLAVSSASVRVVATLTVPPGVSPSSVQAACAALASDPAAASAALGVTIVSISSATELKALMGRLMKVVNAQGEAEKNAASEGGATYISHPSIDSKHMDQEIVAFLRKLALALAVAVAKHPPPPDAKIERAQGTILDNVASAGPQTRHALIMVGAPGSGKSKIRKQYWDTKMAGVDKVIIDPDQWSDVFQHDQNLRTWFNYLNQETFLKAMRAHKPLIFDGTGKDLQNTCGRIIDRLHEENYQVTILIVLASYQTCLRRIEKRAKETGRTVPETVVEGAFKGLKTSVPFYRNFASNELLKDKVHKVHVVINNADADGEPSVDFENIPGDGDITALLASHEMAITPTWCVNPTTIQAPFFGWKTDYLPIDFRYDPDTSTANFENLEFVRIEQDDAIRPTGWYDNVIARKGCASFKFILGMNHGHAYTGFTYKRWVEFKVASRTDPRVTRVAHDINGLDSNTPKDKIIQFFKDNLQFKNEAQKARLDRLFTPIDT